MKTLVGTKYLSREDWLKWRKNGLGGSDAGAIAGVNPWRSAMELSCAIRPQNCQVSTQVRVLWNFKRI